MGEALLTFCLAFTSEFLVAFRVMSTAERRPVVAGLFACSCRTTALLVVLVAVKDSWWCVAAAGVGYLLGPMVAVYLKGPVA